MNSNSRVDILLIEDNPGDARLIQEMLAERQHTQFNLKHADQLSGGLAQLTAREFDLVLLDLSLPDSQGLDTFIKAQAEASQVPIVVLTGSDDEELAIEAVRKGAQDYLVKSDVDSRLLIRALRYAIERHRLWLEVEQTRQQQEQELQALVRLSGPTQTIVTAQMFGLTSMRQAVPDLFEQSVQRYGKIMELALEQRAYKVEHNISEDLRDMAEQLGFVMAGPRDLVEVHMTAVTSKIQGATPAKTQAYIGESRLLVLELMGYLVSFYRNLSAGR